MKIYIVTESSHYITYIRGVFTEEKKADELYDDLLRDAGGALDVHVAELAIETNASIGGGSNETEREG